MVGETSGSATPLRRSAGSAGWIGRVPGLTVTGWRLGALVGLVVAVYVTLGALDELLTTMHPPDLVGRGLAQGFSTLGLGGGSEAANATIATWRAFDAISFSGDLPSAFAVARAWLVLDCVYVGLYLASLLALARPGGPWSGGGTVNTLAATRLVVFAVAAVDVAENVTALVVLSQESPSAVMLDALFVLRSVKLFGLVLPMVGLVVLLILRKLQALVRTPRIRQGLLMARTQILVVVAIALALSYGPSADVLLDIGTTQTIAMAVFGGLLCASLAVSARVLIDRDRVGHLSEAQSAPLRDRRWGTNPATIGGFIGLVGAGVLAVLGTVTGMRGLLGAATVVATVVLTSWALQDAESVRATDVGVRSSARIPVVLGLAPLGLVGIALIHWTLWADIVLRQPPRKAVVGVVLIVAACVLVPLIGAAVEVAQTASASTGASARRMRIGGLARRAGSYPPSVWLLIVASLTVPSILLFLATRVPDERYLGPMSLLFGAAATLNLLGTALVVFADAWRDEFGLPSVFKALRMRRIPVFLLLALWLGINTVAFAEPSYYDLETAGTNQRVSLEDAYADWKEANVAAIDGAVPLVVVAAEGGGLRSAYWTERVLTEVFSGSDVQPFALSGTSGGSVGVATYLASQRPLDGTGGGTGLAEVPDPDFLSAVFLHWFTVDLAHSLLRQPATTGDRSRALADALAAEIPGLSEPYDYAPAAGGYQPVTVFNATDLQDGCLLPISTLTDLAGPAVTDDGHGCLDPDRAALDDLGRVAFPGAADIAHGCAGRGVTFATAAVASSRSPWVTPAARLENCGGGVFYIADGGYVDNSGAVAARVILERTEAMVAADNAAGMCIVPILLQIDNGAESLEPGGQATGNPPQLGAILSGAIAANSARHDVAKVAAAAVVEQPLRDADGNTIEVTIAARDDGGPEAAGRYWRIFPVAQAGRDATVGWLLSQPSKDALDTQIATAVAEARRLLDADSGLACR